MFDTKMNKKNMSVVVLLGTIFLCITTIQPMHAASKITVVCPGQPAGDTSCVSNNVFLGLTVGPLALGALMVILIKEGGKTISNSLKMPGFNVDMTSLGKGGVDKAQEAKKKLEESKFMQDKRKKSKNDAEALGARAITFAGDVASNREFQKITKGDVHEDLKGKSRTEAATAVAEAKQKVHDAKGATSDIQEQIDRQEQAKTGLGRMIDNIVRDYQQRQILETEENSPEHIWLKQQINPDQEFTEEEKAILRDPNNQEAFARFKNDYSTSPSARLLSAMQIDDDNKRQEALGALEAEGVLDRSTPGAKDKLSKLEQKAKQARFGGPRSTLDEELKQKKLEQARLEREQQDLEQAFIDAHTQSLKPSGLNAVIAMAKPPAPYTTPSNMTSQAKSSATAAHNNSSPEQQEDLASKLANPETAGVVYTEEYAEEVARMMHRKMNGSPSNNMYSNLIHGQTRRNLAVEFAEGLQKRSPGITPEAIEKIFLSWLEQDVEELFGREKAAQYREEYGFEEEKPITIRDLAWAKQVDGAADFDLPQMNLAKWIDVPFLQFRMHPKKGGSLAEKLQVAINEAIRKGFFKESRATGALFSKSSIQGILSTVSRDDEKLDHFLALMKKNGLITDDDLDINGGDIRQRLLDGDIQEVVVDLRKKNKKFKAVFNKECEGQDFDMDQASYLDESNADARQFLGDVSEIWSLYGRTQNESEQNTLRALNEGAGNWVCRHCGTLNSATDRVCKNKNCLQKKHKPNPNTAATDPAQLTGTGGLYGMHFANAFGEEIVSLDNTAALEAYDDKYRSTFGIAPSADLSEDQQAELQLFAVTQEQGRALLRKIKKSGISLEGVDEKELVEAYTRRSMGKGTVDDDLRVFNFLGSEPGNSILDDKLRNAISAQDDGERSGLLARAAGVYVDASGRVSQDDFPAPASPTGQDPTQQATGGPGATLDTENLTASLNTLSQGLAQLATNLPAGLKQPFDDLVVALKKTAASTEKSMSALTDVLESRDNTIGPSLTTSIRQALRENNVDAAAACAQFGTIYDHANIAAGRDNPSLTSETLSAVLASNEVDAKFKGDFISKIQEFTGPRVSNMDAKVPLDFLATNNNPTMAAQLTMLCAGGGTSPQKQQLIALLGGAVQGDGDLATMGARATSAVEAMGGDAGFESLTGAVWGEGEEANIHLIQIANNSGREVSLLKGVAQHYAKQEHVQQSPKEHRKQLIIAKLQEDARQQRLGNIDLEHFLPQLDFDHIINDRVYELGQTAPSQI